MVTGSCIRVIFRIGLQPECVISQMLRFTTQMQHVHKMYRRWGPNVRQMEVIRRHLESQGRKMDQIPVVSCSVLQGSKGQRVHFQLHKVKIDHTRFRNSLLKKQFFLLMTVLWFCTCMKCTQWQLPVRAKSLQMCTRGQRHFRDRKYVPGLGPRHQLTSGIQEHKEREVCVFFCIQLGSSFLQVGGIEVDLPFLYAVVQKHGGMQQVINQRKWAKIADAMHIPKNVSAVRKLTLLDVLTL